MHVQEDAGRSGEEIVKALQAEREAWLRLRLLAAGSPEQEEARRAWRAAADRAASLVSERTDAFGNKR